MASSRTGCRNRAARPGVEAAVRACPRCSTPAEPGGARALPCSATSTSSVSWARRTAGRHWPPHGVPPTARASTRWATSTTATPSSRSSTRSTPRPTSLVSHLNGPDTAAHLYGPDSEGALAGYRDTDAVLAEVRDHIAWDDTVWILVSDHDQENVDVREPVDLQAEIARRGLELFALPEGSASVVCGEGANAARGWLAIVDGVAGTAPFAVGGRRARVLPGLERAGACLRVHGRAHAAGYARRAPHTGTGRGRHRRSPDGRAAGSRRGRSADRGGRLGTHDRGPARRRPPHGDRPLPAQGPRNGRRSRIAGDTGSPRVGNGSAVGDGFDGGRPPGIETVNGHAGGPSPRSSRRRRRTRSSRSGRCSNANDLVVVHDAALELDPTLRRDSSPWSSKARS